MSSDPYVYPGTAVLRNRPGIREPDQLDRIERQLVTQRAREGIPNGDFDLKHLRAIHRHLFQDVYDWAGELRTIEISKGGHQFQLRRYIETGMADVHRRIRAGGHFVGLSREEFAKRAGEIIGDVNYVHPFREGNGRTQLVYLKQLSSRAGHWLDLREIEPRLWIEASKEAQNATYALMTRVIAAALERSREREGG